MLVRERECVQKAVSSRRAYRTAGRERRAVSAPQPNPSIPVEPTPSGMGSPLPPDRLQQHSSTPLHTPRPIPSLVDLSHSLF